MKKFLSIPVFLMALGTTSSWAVGTKGGWVLSSGFGMTVSPTLFLLNPHLERVNESNLRFGPMIQIAMGDSGYFLTGTMVWRYIYHFDMRMQAFLEGGIGGSYASAIFPKGGLGIHLLGGWGFDYHISEGFAFGTVIRLNIMPPLKTFLISWPLFMIRVSL